MYAYFRLEANQSERSYSCRMEFGCILSPHVASILLMIIRLY